MSIRLKLTFPIIILWGILYIALHFYWLPALSQKDLSRYREEQKKALSLLSLSLSEAIARDDLAQIYSSLDKILESRNDWKSIFVKDKTGIILYPLIQAPYESENTLEHLSWEHRNGDEIFFVLDLATDPWLLLLEQKRSKQELQIAFLFLFCLSLIVGVIVEERFVRNPIRTLDNAIQRLGARNFTTKLPIASKDEIGSLVNAFDNMRNRINTYQSELKFARDEAIAANQVKSIFLAKISHELRTPLNAIIGYSDLICEEAEENFHYVYMTDANRIQQSGKHLLAIINDILDLAKIEEGKIVLVCKSIEIVSFVKDIVDALRPVCEKENTRLEFETVYKKTHISTDPIKLKQILLNLLNNADKFTKAGAITVRIRGDGDLGPDFIVIDVADTGTGIQHIHLEKIFNPFVQVDDSYSRSHEGTGLGLALCKQFIELMHGKIEVTSIVGKGSTFSVILPISLPVAKKDTGLVNHPIVEVN